MKITEIRIKLTDDPRNKLLAYCSVTFEEAFVVRDLKIIDSGRGPFVAMPSRKLTDHCGKCRHKNHLRASYCNQCGARLDPDRAPRDERGRSRLHADLAHPIHAACRMGLHQSILQAYSEELARSKIAGYTPQSFDDLDTHGDELDDDYFRELQQRHERVRPGGGSANAAAEG